MEKTPLMKKEKTILTELACLKVCLLPLSLLIIIWNLFETCVLTISEIRFYYQSSLPFVTSQTLHHNDTVPSVLENNAVDVTAQQEWEAEWNQAGLASRLSEQVTLLHSFIKLFITMYYLESIKA